MSLFYPSGKRMWDILPGGWPRKRFVVVVVLCFFPSTQVGAIQILLIGSLIYDQCIWEERP